MEDKVKFILENYQTMKVQEIADHVGMTYSQTQDVARKAGVRKFKSKPWTDEELEFLYEHFPSKKGKWVAEKLGRGFHATHKMAEKLNIKAEWNYTYVSVQGYLIDCSDRENRILVHRKVMQDHLGRELSSNEIIHHIDGDKLNNSIDNLEIVTRSEHINMHRDELVEAKLKRKR